MDSEGLRSVTANIHTVQHEYPPLTAEEETALCEKYANDRETLRERLVLHNVGFAISYVQKYSERSESREDMWMRGLQGLSEAAREFDPSRGIRFCTFAGYYIQKSMRYLFSPMLAGPKTQLATRPVYDLPLDRDDAEAGTAGDRLVLDAASPSWRPVRPDAETLRGVDSGEVAELVEYLANRFAKTARERDVLRAKVLFQWGHDKIATDVLGTNKETARATYDRLMVRICRAVDRIDTDDELYGMFSRTVREVPKRVDPDALLAFLTRQCVELTDETVLETFEDRAARLTEEYDRAEAEHRLATGRRDEGGADYALMRAVYLDTVVAANRVGVVAERRTLPKTYAMFLRDRAVKMVKQSKDGTFRKMVEKRERHACSPEEHQLKDELFNLTACPGCATVKYDWFLERLSGRDFRSRARKMRRSLVTTWKRYDGGFYSEANYLRLSGRTMDGKTKLTKREVRALAQFCDEVTLQP